MHHSNTDPNYLKTHTINYLPPKIKVDDLYENGTLVSDEEREKINHYHRLMKANEYFRPFKLSKKSPVLKDNMEISQSFIVLKEGVFAIYKGVKLGKGKFGEVKFAQNINTGEWVALKAFKRDPETPKLTQKEIKYNRFEAEMNKAINNTGNYVPMSLGFSDKDYLIMKLEVGENFSDFSKQNRDSLSLQERLLVCENILGCVNEMHDKGISHNDLKDVNLNIGKYSLQVRPMDFGLSCKFAEQHNYLAGSPYGTAPEVLALRPEEFPEVKLSENAKKLPAYSTKSDGYSLGILLAAWFDLKVNWYINGHRSIEQAPSSKFDEFIKDPELRTKIKGLILRLIDEDPISRAEPREIQKIVHAIRDNLGFSLSKSKSIAVLNVQEYLQLSVDDRRKVMEALNQFSEVALAVEDTFATRITPFVWSQIQSDLLNHNVNCSGEYQEYTAASRDRVLVNIQKKYDAAEPSNLFNVVQVSNSLNPNTDLTGGKLNKRIEVAARIENHEMADSIARVYAENQVTKSDIQKIDILLNAEIYRLNAKNKNSDINMRQAAIQSVLSKLNANAGKISYQQLFQTLSTLETNLSKVQKRVFVPVMFQTKSRTVKNVAKINKEIREQIPPLIRKTRR